jgi:hypothetical protein
VSGYRKVVFQKIASERKCQIIFGCQGEYGFQEFGFPNTNAKILLAVKKPTAKLGGNMRC